MLKTKSFSEHLWHLDTFHNFRISQLLKSPTKYT